MGAGVTADPHDVLEAVEAGASRTLDGLAAICWGEAARLHHPGHTRTRFTPLRLTFNSDRHHEQRGGFGAAFSWDRLHVDHPLPCKAQRVRRRVRRRRFSCRRLAASPAEPWGPDTGLIVSST